MDGKLISVSPTAISTARIRQFRDDRPRDDQAGWPKLAAFYEKTRAALDTQPPSRLLLIVDWADATIFVNEHERGMGGVVDMMLPAGNTASWSGLGLAGSIARVMSDQLVEPEDE